MCSLRRLIFSNLRYFQISSVCNFALFHELIPPDSFCQIDLWSSALIYLYFKTVASLLSADESLRCFVVSKCRWRLYCNSSTHTDKSEGGFSVVKKLVVVAFLTLQTFAVKLSG